jgi:hypothetical protein
MPGVSGSGGEAGASAGTSGSGGAAGAAGDGSSGEGGASGGQGGEASVSVVLTIDTGEAIRPISPRIYGVNPRASECSDPAFGFTLCRRGGNAHSTYNWENNASNAGEDDCSENNADLGASDVPGEAVTDFVEAASSVGAAAIVTVPLLDYVAADKNGGSPAPECSGRVTNTANYLTTRFKQSRARKGSALSLTPDTSDAFVNQDEFVAFVDTEASGSDVLYALDNQPELWSFTHPAAHPAPATYAEVIAKNVEYATMIRDLVPSAEVLGYVGYGYQSFIDLQSAPDAAGNGPFLDYYLSELADASEADGRKLVDYLDVHYYSEAHAGAERVVGSGNTPAVAAVRVQAARSLWDESYVEDSWITRDHLSGSSVRLLPWLKERIDALNPELGLSVSEWSFGGGNHISGAIAGADALGAFGREGVALASFVSFADDESFALAAFRVFRNFDGQGAAFGDTSVSATSDDDDVASVYASIDSSDPDRVVIVAINRSAGEVAASVRLEHDVTFSTAAVYALTQASPIPAASGTLTGTANVFEHVLPPFSVSVLVPSE